MKPQPKRIITLVALVAAVSATLWFTVLRGRPEVPELFVSGVVEATESHLGFQAAGRVEAIAVREGDATVRGEELATLDRAEALARRDQAAAQVAAASASLLELQRGFRDEEVAQARAGLASARVRLEDATRDLERTRRLYDGGAVSREVYDKTQMAEDLARSQHDQAKEQLKLMEAGHRIERIDAQRAQLRAAEASLRVVDAALANMVITAPSDGVVTIRHHEPGETVPPGAAVLTVMDPTDRWVRIFVKEDRIGAVALGQPASIRSDTYPERAYEGEVTFIASEAEFTPKNVQTPEERVKLVYSVKVRITGDAGFELKPGMPADVRLELVVP